MRKRILALGLTAAFMLVGCGIGADTGESDRTGPPDFGGNLEERDGHGLEEDQKTMGRYMESDIVLTEEINYALDIRSYGDGVELVAGDGALYQSMDQGRNWQLISTIPPQLREALRGGVARYFQWNRSGDLLAGYALFQRDGEGNIDFNSSSYVHTLFLADGSEIRLDIPEGEFVSTAVCDGNGTFYLGSAHRIYRVNGQDGALEALVELSGSCNYLAACGKYLMIQGEELQIYDLEEDRMAERDPVLGDFLKPWLGQYGDGGSRACLLYMPQEGEGLYVLTEKGLYHHTLYGSTMEQLIDGSLCSMGDFRLGFMGMAKIGDVFWVLYDGGQIRQYTYDPAIPAAPEDTLRIWGLYEDEDIKRVVSAFGQTHPELYVVYEHPLAEDTGMTKEDAVKVLSTELAAGSGPDVLLLDGLPYDSYVEKGILADLTAALDGTGERYMDMVRVSYQRDGGQYAMPMALSVPILMGTEEEIRDITDLEQLADLAEAARAARPEGSLLGFGGAQEALELLATGSMDSWMDESGGMNREAIEEFLTLSKRIYDAQLAGLSTREQEALDMMVMSMGGRMVERTEAGYQLSNAICFAQPYALGAVDSNLSVMGGYCTAAEMMKVLEMSFVPMPGQTHFLGQASGILAVNEKSALKQQALELVIYALSAQFARESYMVGGSANWDVLDAQEAKEVDENYGAFIGLEDINGKAFRIEVGPPSPEAAMALRQLLENCQGVSQCDSRVYDAVLEEGQKALTEELTVQEAVKAIERKVALYLAE